MIAGASAVPDFPGPCVSSFSAVGNSTSALLCPLGACNCGTGAMKTIKNDTVNEYLEESHEDWTLQRSAPCMLATLSCSAVKITFDSFFHAAPNVGDSFLLLCSLFHQPEKQLQHFCLSSSKSPLSALFFPCLPAPGSFLALLAPSFAPCQHTACLRFLSS